ncbi:arylamine N-acetyltransferase [bacterium]|nr:arylamine N-acetyltransferase [bacterium]RQV94385.1 MAG: arylamine N-acetyltransferase [bacterium]
MHSSAIILNPSSHREAVDYFKHHFSLGKGLSETDLLEEILSYFSQFPYENISKIIKYQKHFDGPVKIRLPYEVMDNHVSHRLGGTCFSLTFFLQTILIDFGFACYPVMADMRWGKRVHCALLVIMNRKKYLVDPGYLLNQPLEISKDQNRLYKTPFSGVEVDFRQEGETYELFTFDQTERKWRYRFQDKPVSDKDFLTYWLDSFSWNSMHGLCLTKIEKSRMIYIHKTFMRETDFERKKNVNIKDHYHATISQIFGIDSQLVEEALAAIESNMAREREMGIWVPNKEWRPM